MEGILSSPDGRGVTVIHIYHHRTLGRRLKVLIALDHDTIAAGPTLDKQREIELTRALMKGHAGAFEEFVEHFRSKIFQYSWLMCGQREDAEEVAQETLLRIFQSFSQLRPPPLYRGVVKTYRPG